MTANPALVQKFYQAALFLLVALFFLGTRVKIGGFSVNAAVISIAGIAILQAILWTKSHIATYYRFKWVVAGILFLAVYSALVQYSINGMTYSYYFSQICVTCAGCVIVSAAIFNIMTRLNVSVFSLFNMIFWVVAINGVVMLTSFLIPNVRVFIENLLAAPVGAENINYQTVSWRLRGLAAAGGASLSIFMAFGVGAGAIATISDRLRFFIFVLLGFIVVLSLFVVARTGLYMATIIYVATCLYQLTFRFRRSIVTLALTLPIIVGFTFEVWPSFSAVSPWALELATNVFTGQGLRSHSTDDLLAMFGRIGPDQSASPSEAAESVAQGRLVTPMNWLFGFGFFDGNATFRNDSGYMKTIFSVGIVLGTVIYGFMLFQLLCAVRRTMSPVASVFWVVIVLFLFVLEVKEPFLYQNYTARATILLITVAMATNGARTTLSRRSAMDATAPASNSIAP